MRKAELKSFNYRKCHFLKLWQLILVEGTLNLISMGRPQPIIYLLSKRIGRFHSSMATDSPCPELEIR